MASRLPRVRPTAASASTSLSPTATWAVIGKRGRRASAIRTVVRAAGVDDDVTAIEVEFVD